MRTLTLLLLIITNSLAAYSQINQRLKPKDQRYKDIIEELGNPLEGKPLMIINYSSFAPIYFHVVA